MPPRYGQPFHPCKDARGRAQLERVRHLYPPSILSAPVVPDVMDSVGFHPRAKFDLGGPGAALLAMNVKIGCGDRIGIEQPVRAALIGARVVRPPDAAVDHKMRDVDV